MLQDQQERSRERMVKLGQSSDEAVMFGAIGRRGTAIVLMLLGGFYILGGIIALNSQAQFPLAVAIFALVWGLILVTIGVLNFVIRHLTMLLANGILLIVAGLLTLMGNFIGAVVQLAIGIYFIYRYSNTAKFRRQEEERRQEAEDAAQISPEVQREIDQYIKRTL